MVSPPELFRIQMDDTVQEETACLEIAITSKENKQKSTLWSRNMRFPRFQDLKFSQA